MIFHFPNLLFGHPLDTLFVATIRAFVTARVAMISRSTSSRTLYLYHVSNLKFLSKAIEKVAATRLTDYLRDNDLPYLLIELFYIGMPVVRTDGRSGGRAVYGHVITKFSRMCSLPYFFTRGAPLRALRARELRYEFYFRVQKQYFTNERSE